MGVSNPYCVLQIDRIKKYKNDINDGIDLEITEIVDFLVCLHTYFEYQINAAFALYRFIYQDGNIKSKSKHKLITYFQKISFLDKYKFYVLMHDTSEECLDNINSLITFSGYRNTIIHSGIYNSYEEIYVSKDGNRGKLELEKKRKTCGMYVSIKTCFEQCKRYEELLLYLDNIFQKDKNVPNALKPVFSLKLSSVFTQIGEIETD